MQAAVFQVTDKAGRPVVYSWSQQKGLSAGPAGHRLVASEMAAPRAWLTPADRDEPDGWPATAAFNSADRPVRGLLSLEKSGAVGSSKRPQTCRFAAWTPIAGNDGSSAVLSADASIGANPSRLVMESSGGRNVSVRLSKGRTFLPIGWSPSGRWFAIALMPDAKHPGLLAGDHQHLAELAVVDAHAGAVVATDVVRTSDGPSAAWDRSQDRLYYSRRQGREHGNSSYDELMAFEAATGRTRRYSDVFAEAPQSWGHVFSGSIKRGSAGDPIVGFWWQADREQRLELFALSSHGPRDLGDVRLGADDFLLDWAPSGDRLLMIVERREEKGSAVRRFLTVKTVDMHGDSERKLWERPLPGDPYADD